MSTNEQNNIQLFNNINKRVFDALYSSVIEAGLRPFVVCITSFVEGLPPELYKQNVCVLNLSPDAIGEYIEGVDRFETKIRFNTVARDITIKYVGVVAMNAMEGSKQIHSYKLNSHEFVDNDFLKDIQKTLTVTENTEKSIIEQVETSRSDESVASENKPSTIPGKDTKVSYLKVIK